MMSQRKSFQLTLEPMAGFRFQPTGFPDLGAATFKRPAGGGKWVDALHVESPQSMANRLELMTWDLAAQAQRPELDGLPYVRVIGSDGQVLTSSRLEAHRLASAYIMDGHIESATGEAWFAGKLGLERGRAMDHRALAQAIFQLDPVSLLHGVFFARKAWPWQPKIARAVTCFIDADDVQPAVSGGVKTDSVNTQGGNTDTGYGMVPHQRVEYTAQKITAFITVDHQQMRSYGLESSQLAVLEALASFEIAQLFGGGGLRLRTACDLKVVSGTEDMLPTPEEATQTLRSAIAACDSLGEVTDVLWTERSSKKK